MAKVKGAVTWKKGYRRDIIEMLLNIGVITRRGISVLEMNEKVYMRTINKMVEEGLLEKHNVKHMQTVIIKKFEDTYQAYIKEFEKGYYGYHNRYTKTVVDNIIKYGSDANVYERSVRDSEAAVFMIASDAKVYMTEKEELRKEHTLEIRDATYYRISEIKYNENMNRLLLQTRCNGWLSSPGGEYLVYMLRDKQIRWSRMSEESMCTYMTNYIHERKAEFSGEVREGIFLGYSCKIFERLVSQDKQIATNLNVSVGLPVMYAIPYDNNGKMLLHIMTKKGWKEKLKERYLSEMEFTNDKMSIHTAYDGETKVLLHCIPDLVRLKKFVGMAMVMSEPDSHCIYCFDFQEEYVRKTAGEYCYIVVIPFQSIEI